MKFLELISWVNFVIHNIKYDFRLWFLYPYICGTSIHVLMKNFLKDSNFNKLAMLSTISISTLLMILSGTASFVSNNYYTVYAAAQNVTKTTSSSLTGGSAGGSNGGGGSQQASTAHCDRPGFPSCASLGSQAGKSAPGTSCPPGHSQAFCNAYTVAAGSPTINNNNPGVSSQQEASHCDQPGYPSCYSLGYQAGKTHIGTGCPGGHSAKYCVGWNAGAGNTTHCDQPMWPSCYTLGYQAGTNALGTSCPTGHSQAFCNGYEYGSGGNGRAYIQGVTDPTHCGQPGFPACYDVGNHDGYNNAVNEHHQFNNSCPLGHSKTFCNGYVPGYNLGVSYNLGYSRGVNNSNHDWESSNHDIHAFNYDCPSTPSKDFCNGYIDGYGDGVHDILG
jgi:hypothetical protein